MVGSKQKWPVDGSSFDWFMHGHHFTLLVSCLHRSCCFKVNWYFYSCCPGTYLLKKCLLFRYSRRNLIRVHRLAWIAQILISASRYLSINLWSSKCATLLINCLPCSRSVLGEESSEASAGGGEKQHQRPARVTRTKQKQPPPAPVTVVASSTESDSTVRG